MTKEDHLNETFVSGKMKKRNFKKMFKMNVVVFFLQHPVHLFLMFAGVDTAVPWVPP